jgi:hypothetical protein
VNGTTTLGGVNLSFVQDTPAGVGAASNQTVNFGNKWWSCWLFLFLFDPALLIQQEIINLLLIY